MNGQELWKALGEVDDRYLDMVDALDMEQRKMKAEKKRTYTRKAFTVLIAAAISVSILAVTAMAAGWVPKIFQSLKTKEPEEAELFEAAAQANSEAVPEKVEIPGLDLSSFTLFERYYDGQTILLGYNMDLITPPLAVGYIPDDETLSKLQSGTDCMEFSQADNYDPWSQEPTTENAKEHGFSERAENMDRMFHYVLSQEEYEKAWRILKENGYVCIVNHYAYLGDHVLVNGVDMIETMGLPGAEPFTDYETEEGRCRRLGPPLPEAGQNQDQVTVTLKIGSNAEVWYLDLQGNARSTVVDHNQEYIDFVLENVSSK